MYIETKLCPNKLCVTPMLKYSIGIESFSQTHKEKNKATFSR